MILDDERMRALLAPAPTTWESVPGLRSAAVLAPIFIDLGIEPLHFAIVMILTLNVANITPPVGMTLMTAAKIAEVPYERAIRQSLPFLLSHLVVIVLVSIFPMIALWLPSLLH